MSKKDFSVYALKAVQPSQSDAGYWIPQLFSELKKGNARFGWGRKDVLLLSRKIDKKGIQSLLVEERVAWDHASFLLEVKPNDYLVYINMPEYGWCSLVQVLNDGYAFSDIWDLEERGDFQHFLRCRFISSFDRNDSAAVPPYLSVRLKLQGSHWRINVEDEFQELLQNLSGKEQGRTAEQRLSVGIGEALESVVESIRQNFPNKSLEPLVQKIFEAVPNVRDVRKGPDRDGADLVIEFEAGIPGLPRTEICAVQVKAYEGTMGYERAIKDIEKAFTMNPEYTCGLIVSTALELSPQFEANLETLRNNMRKPIGILLGKDLALTLIKHHAMADEAE